MQELFLSVREDARAFDLVKRLRRCAALSMARVVPSLVPGTIYGKRSLFTRDNYPGCLLVTRSNAKG